MGIRFTITLLRDTIYPLTRPMADYELHYSYVLSDLVGQPEETAQTRTDSINVSISTSLISVWRLQNNQEVHKILYEHAKRAIIKNARADALYEPSPIELTTATEPSQRPFDPARINIEFNVPFEIETQATDYSSPSKSRTTEGDVRGTSWDFFICHATEDKIDVVGPLAEMLRSRDFRVWYDRWEITIGDSLRRKIDEGLRESRYGIVILSPAFLRKESAPA